MALRAIKYERIIFETGGTRIVQLGKNCGRNTCTTLPDTMEEVRNGIKKYLRNNLKERKTHTAGSGDLYILENKCELKYYQDGKLVKHLRDE